MILCFTVNCRTDRGVVGWHVVTFNVSSLGGGITNANRDIGHRALRLTV
jgi:hypothetical protein